MIVRAAFDDAPMTVQDIEMDDAPEVGDEIDVDGRSGRVTHTKEITGGDPPEFKFIVAHLENA